VTDDLPTPHILIDAAIVRRNVAKMAEYASAHNLKLRPHTKTHKSVFFATMQTNAGAAGLTVAKPGEARVMGIVANEILMAYPAVGRGQCAELVELAGTNSVTVGIDSTFAADRLAAAAHAAGVMLGILVDLDVGHHRTGVQNPADALALAQYVDASAGLQLEGVMFFPGQISMPPAEQSDALAAVDALLGEVLSLWKEKGLEAKVVSGGSTPTAFQSHLVKYLTEIRPGTYIFNDMNCVHGKSATFDDCAARIIATVVSTAVPGQIVLDAGSKTLTSDRCGPAPDSGHGYIVEFPQAKVTKLSEEHAQVDVRNCDPPPRIGQRVSIIPNHICPCINLQDKVWWQEDGGFGSADIKPLRVDARGKVY
jgi:D-serine deaminase-like pyridoxal phosphate-dependent protein